MKKVFVLLIALLMVFMSSVSVFANLWDNEEDDLKAAEQYINDAEHTSSYYYSAENYRRAAVIYEHYRKYKKAYEYFGKAAETYEKGGYMDEAEANYDSQRLYEGCEDVASIFSEGNLTIIVGLASAVVFGLLGFLLGRKSKSAKSI